jgi:hypothetical protein
MIMALCVQLKKILAAQWVMEYDDICNVAP